MGGFGDLLGGLGQLLGGLVEGGGESAVEAVAVAAEGGEGEAYTGAVDRYLTGGPRALNVNDL